MAKPIELKVEVDTNGKVHVTINGTTGTECLTHMAFLDNIAGFTVIETEHIREDDPQDSNMKSSIDQKIG